MYFNFSIRMFCYLYLSDMKFTVLQLACAVSIAYENETDQGPEIFSKDKFCGIEVGVQFSPCCQV